MPSEPEGSYFVRLDAPPALSRVAERQRDTQWSQPSAPPPRRRRRPVRIRPAGVLVLVVLAWVGWALTTPGGPSARIQSWVDHTRGVVEDASANPDLHQAATYFNGLYARQRGYPDPSDTDLQSTPAAGFGLGMSFLWCGPRDVVLQTLSSGGTISRLLLDGHDLGNVPNARACPANLSDPAPWKVHS